MITIQIGVCTALGTPWFVAATVLSINHVRSLTKESESAAPGERPKFLGIRYVNARKTLRFVVVVMTDGAPYNEHLQMNNRLNLIEFLLKKIFRDAIYTATRFIVKTVK